MVVTTTTTTTITTNNSNDSNSNGNNYQNMDNYVIDSTSGGGGGGGDIETTILNRAAVVSTNVPPEPVVGKGLLKPIPELTTLEAIAGTIGTFVVVLAIVAIILENGAITTVAGIGSIVLGIYLYYQQTVLTDIRTLIETKQVLQNEVTILQQSNEQFQKDIDSLTKTVTELTIIRTTLQNFDTKYKNSVSELELIVRKNQQIASSMNTNYIGRILQNFISMLLRNDTDKDSTVDPNEVTILIQQIQPLIPDDIIFHDTEFRTAITGKSLPDVISLIKNILNDVSTNNNATNKILTTTSTDPTTTTPPIPTDATSTDRGTVTTVSSSNRRIFEYRSVTIVSNQQNNERNDEQGTSKQDDNQPHLT